MAQRFPEIDWRITAGNSSPLTDGASAVLIMSEAKASELGLQPKARFHSFAVAGSDPLLMLTGVIPATQKILERSGLSIDKLDAYEVNEAFAPVPLVWPHELAADPQKLNPRPVALPMANGPVRPHSVQRDVRGARCLRTLPPTRRIGRSRRHHRRLAGLPRLMQQTVEKEVS
jgi:thiolase-like protein